MTATPQSATDVGTTSVLCEAVCRQLIGASEAFDAVEKVFAAMAQGSARNFPVVREAIGHADALYGLKSGFDKANMALGVKADGYWPRNMAKNLANHQSAILLFNPDTGRLQSIVDGNYPTALRTAASSAVSIRYLSRENSTVLGIIGAGLQSTFQLRAALAVRNFEKVIAWNKTPSKLEALAAVAQEHGLPFEEVDLRTMGSQADVIITITSCFEALLKKDWIKPGTHIACMGTDTKGKQEVDPELVIAANIFADEISQSVLIGECQHAVATGAVGFDDITEIGHVINGDHPGRANDEEITLFDGTGLALQDLAVASVAAKLARESGKAQLVDW